jgi:hypothetical protein
MLIYPSAYEVELYECAATADPWISRYWREFYSNRAAAMRTMRELALSYSE